MTTEQRFCDLCKANQPTKDFTDGRGHCKRHRGRRVEVGRSYEKRREDQLQHQYSISYAEYREWVDGQGGCCAICGVHEDDLTKALAIDHCHVEGDIRGVLCARCNIGLGFFRDDPDRLISAARYLEFGGVQHGHLVSSDSGW